MQSETANNLKRFIKGIPVLGPTGAKLSRASVFAAVRRLAFPGSASFWERVYSRGGTSGPGSYGHLAKFKAEVLNDFVRKRHIQTVIEFGCGDGAQLQLAQYPQYVGVDVAASSVSRCTSLFAHDYSKRFFRADTLPKDIGSFDLALSLDVIYHLVEDPVFDGYMRRLFQHAKSHVAIYASNYEALTSAPHVRHREFTNWIDKHAPDWRLAGFISNPFPFDPERPEETSHADFYFFCRRKAGDACACEQNGAGAQYPFPVSKGPKPPSRKF